ILQLARDVAERIVEEDPTCQLPKYELLWRQLKALRKTNINWSAIS
nr:ATP-dependent DNA helicase RecG [Bacteroidaceae bacterium]